MILSLSVIGVLNKTDHQRFFGPITQTGPIVADKLRLYEKPGWNSIGLASEGMAIKFT